MYSISAVYDRQIERQQKKIDKEVDVLEDIKNQKMRMMRANAEIDYKKRSKKMPTQLIEMD